jgi:CRISPR-associated protein Csm5
MDDSVRAYGKSLGLKYNVDLEVITPLHIGSGDLRSPLGDYFIKQGAETKELRFLNAKKFSALLSSKNKTETYINKVLLATVEDKSEFINKFFRDDLGENLIDSITDTAYPVRMAGNPVELQEFIKSDGRPFIPGSSLKGALRSVLLFNWLFFEDGKQVLENWLKTFFDIYEKDLPPGKKGQFMEDSFKTEVEEEFFGRLRDKNRLVMSCLKVSDSGFAGNDTLAAYELLRYNLVTGAGSIPTLKECIDITGGREGMRTSVAIDFLEKDTIGRQLQAFKTPQQMCATINKLSSYVLDYEIEVTEKAHDSLNIYCDWLEKIKEMIKIANGNTCYLRLGQGKMQFYQTTAMKIFEIKNRDESNDDWVDYLKFCAGFHRKGIGDIYPITRSLTSTGQMPAGWMKMSIK